MKNLILLLAVMLFCVRSYAATLYVNVKDPDGYPTIQAAIDAALDGDVVIVAPGTYQGDGNRDIDYNGKAITVRSENGPEDCVIDCQGSYPDPHRGFYFHSGEGNDSVVEGFTIINGRTSAGGGIFCHQSNPVIKGCVLHNNSAGSQGEGGGIGIARTTNAVVINCVLYDNFAEYGGGISCMRGDAKIINTLIYENYGSGHGGGICCARDNFVQIVNCTIERNTASNWGGGIFCNWDTNVEAVNCIIRDNKLPRRDEFEETGREITLFHDSYITVRHSHVKGGHAVINSPEYVSWGAGNVDASPKFVNTGDDNYRLSSISPCIDAGDNSFVTVDTDLDGNRRIIDGDLDRVAIVDIGAYEYINPDTPPVADAGENVTVAADSQSGTAIVILDGSLSYDENGDELEYLWFNEGQLFGEGMEVEAELGTGEFVFALIVNDGTEDSEPDEVVVTVIDDVGPEFSVRMDRRVLWPVNNKMVKVTPSFEVSDNCGGEVSIEMVGVTCDQKSANDIEVTDDGIFLRAKRDGNDKGGRIYTITYKATDESGNETAASTEVRVPHDLGRRGSISRYRRQNYRRGTGSGRQRSRK